MEIFQYNLASGLHHLWAYVYTSCLGLLVKMVMVMVMAMAVVLVIVNNIPQVLRQAY